MDSDGIISYNEFEKWYSVYSQNNNKHESPKMLFQSHDFNGDSKLTIQEFVPLAFAISRKPVEEGVRFFKVGFLEKI